MYAELNRPPGGYYVIKINFMSIEIMKGYHINLDTSTYYVFAFLHLLM